MRNRLELIGTIVGFILVCYLFLHFGVPLYERYMNAMGISSDCIMSNDPWMCEQVRSLHK